MKWGQEGLLSARGGVASLFMLVARPSVLLCTLNATWQHAAFGLRYLLANLPEDLQAVTRMAEFTINMRTLDVVERVLESGAQVVGFGVYIWNVTETERVVAALRRLRPDLRIVLGGPEVSYECDQQEIVRMADVVITGEADVSLAEILRLLLAGERPAMKIMQGRLPQPSELRLPYHLYTAEDLAKRVIYVEASRGCPYTCEFCLSSLAIPVRAFSLEVLLPAFGDLLERGARRFKFVDRTFNLNIRMSRAIMEFFLARWQPGLFLHFEMIPDRLPADLREVIRKFPSGALQFEVGVQTFDPGVAVNISRRNDLEKLEENLRFLRTETGVHVHADLIAGLPGETMESFARGFDRLVAMRPQEIQVGILKRLRGTPIMRHDESHAMRYAAHPPYEVLETGAMTFAELNALRRFAKVWDLVGNSGNFVESTPLLCGPTPFAAVMSLTNLVHARCGTGDGIALLRLVETIFDFLTTNGVPAAQAAAVLWRDYTRAGRTERAPGFLAEHLGEPERPAGAARARSRHRELRMAHSLAPTLSGPDQQISRH